MILATCAHWPAREPTRLSPPSSPALAATPTPTARLATPEWHKATGWPNPKPDRPAAGAGQGRPSSGWPPVRFRRARRLQTKGASYQDLASRVGRAVCSLAGSRFELCRPTRPTRPARTEASRRNGAGLSLGGRLSSGPVVRGVGRTKAHLRRGRRRWRRRRWRESSRRAAIVSPPPAHLFTGRRKVD